MKLSKDINIQLVTKLEYNEQMKFKNDLSIFTLMPIAVHIYYTKK